MDGNQPMNTSFPSAASDFASLLAGGKQPNTNAQLKGIFANLACSKPAKSESAGAAITDFEAMLASPASSENASHGAANSPSDSAGKPAGDVVTRAIVGGWCNLMVDINDAITTTLQIKGMGNGPDDPVLPAMVTVTPENPVVAQVSTPESESLPVPLTPVAEISIPTILVKAAALVPDAPSGPICPKKENVGLVVPRQIRLLPGCGQSLRGVGANPALVVHPGLKGKNLIPAPTDLTADNPVVPMLPVPPTELQVAAIITANGQLPAIPAIPMESESDSAAVSETAAGSSPLTDLSPEIVSSPIPTIYAPVASVVASDAEDSALPVNLQPNSSALPDQSVLPNATLAPDLVPVPTGPIAIFSDPVSEELPNQPILSAVASGEGAFTPVSNTPIIPSALPSPIVSAEEIPVGNPFELPAVETVQTTMEVPAVAIEATETDPLTPEVRRDVIETVAAMLAPFMMTLPVIPPELFPNQSAAQAGDVLAGGGSAAKSLTVTVKVGTQSSFSFELPQSSLSESGTTDILAASTATDETSDRPDDAPKAFLLPATMSQLADADQTVDFRVQLKAVVDAAWSQAEKAATKVESAPVPVAVAEVAEPMSDSNNLVRVVVAAPLPAVPESSQPSVNAEPANAILPAALPAEQPPTTQASPGSVEVMIEMPGIGSMTTQVVASDGTTLSLEKKPGNRLGRAEKSAGNFKSTASKDSRENTGSEKTFLSTGVQSLKDKTGNAGTDVAISDDTMPARFTSRRVAVDQLEFPPRLNAREIQPEFTPLQKLSDSIESPVATTPAPVLAHRAVETILNVVEAQRQGAANASSVNLHFKFGAEDLAVRVQLRGGEVLTQFMTDSAELRGAISSEWQVMAGQGSTAGLRLHEPTIVAASAGTSSGFGSAAQGQNQGRQQAQQQQEQAAAMMPEFHPLRQRAAGIKPLPEVAPRVSIAPKTSQHLTATA